MRNAWLYPLTHWNWKAALITAICRAGACMAALYHSPLHAREHFGAVEACYVLLTAGIFSAWQQQALDVKPKRLAWTITVLAIPLGSLAADSALHLWLDHGNMRALGIGAVIVTVFSAMFHWHVMQNGALLVGENSRSFMDDMRAMPRLAASFVTQPFAAISSWRSEPEVEEA
ncbi:hypothetical protein [Silvibacterium dinghuense]|uniref:Uncharacterized protein n=1 Tax=Silvibacterium dinghuense TaxID=1560006 RepID=A0A4Q1SJM8_9BACT|nr:hypothetical protein [Silvibacterium dinghuense]RXS97643.1 hypothetical protein ESZ00_07130 [Silvibacterium dinghuense]GGH00779.1 hypothetical protein GCM10011586_15470 [Silvibacterium dinghuense]